MLRKIFLLVLIFALVVPCAYARKSTPHTVMRVSDLDLCPAGRSCVDGSGNMKMGAATIGATGSISEETNTMTFDDGDGLPITLQEIREATGGADTAAIHDDTAGEINALSQEGSALEDGDALVGENAQNSYAKIKILLSEIATYIQAKLGITAFGLTLTDDDNATEACGTLGIEPGADVTDATNVAAAGAVMDGDFSANGLMRRTGAGAYSVLSVGTLTDTYVCVYSTANGLVCNTDPITFSGAGDDLGDANATDIVTLFGSGSCSGYLKSDGSCDIPSGSEHDAVTLSTDLGNNLLGLSTQQITLDNQTANYIFAGPATGAAAAPAFRAMVDADIPSAIARDTEIHAAVTIGSGIGGITISTQELSLAARLEAYHDYTDPNADRIWFWDDSAGAFAGLQASTGLEISTTFLRLTNTGVTANSYTNSSITVDAQGRITSASSGTAFDPASPGAIGGTTPAAGAFTTVVADSFTARKVSGIAGDMGLYEANSTDTHAAGWRGPASITGDGAYRGQLPNARASSANMVLAWTNVAESGTGTAVDPYVQAMSFVDLDNYQAADADLTTWAGITPGIGIGTWLATPTIGNWFSTVTGEGAFASTLLGYADAAAVRTGLSLVPGTDVAAVGHTTQYAATPVIDDPDNFAANFTGGNLYGGTFIANAAGTAALPDPSVGMNFTIVLETTGEVIVDPLGTGTADTIVMNGLAATADENITAGATGALGDACVFQYRAANSWMATCTGWAEATPP